MTEMGPGRVELAHAECELKPDYNPFFFEAAKRLMALPNAFDTITGKLNKENDEAVFLYTLLKHQELISQFPIIWKYNERAENTDGSDQPN